MDAPFRAQPKAEVQGFTTPVGKKGKETPPHVSGETGHRKVFHGETEKFVCGMHVCTSACTHTCAPENKTGRITERISDYRSIVLKDNLVFKSKSKIGDTESGRWSIT